MICSKDLKMDIQARHEGEEKYGYETWFSGHRNGESGIDNPGTQDIKSEFYLISSPTSRTARLTLSTDYMDGVAWIQEQLESDEKYQSDDTRFYVSVVAI